MIMPFLRLVVIYIVVILGALMIFKRDSVMSLTGLPWGGDDTEVSATGEAVPAPVLNEVETVPNATNASGATPETNETSSAQSQTAPPPKYPTDETAQVVKPAPPQSAQTAESDIQTRLDQARKTYWNRDMAGAEKLYISLAQDAPENADIKGELGNLYFSQRRMPQAAQMYHQTGLQLIKDGNTGQIMPLIGVLQSIAPELANDLRTRLSQ